MGFVHTHRHSEFSMLDGTGTARQYAEEAARLGQSALAQTDHATLGGALHHIEACKEHGILPIVGVEAYFREERKVQGQKEKLNEYYHMVLLAKDLKGWHSLLRLTSEAYASGFYGKPCVDYDLLQRNSEGIMCTTACMSGYVPAEIIRGNDKGVKNHIEKLKSIFGDDIWVEIMPHDFEEQKVINREMISIAHEIGAPLLATADAHYPYKDWADTQDVLLMVSTNQSFKKRAEKREKGEDVYTFDCPTLYLQSEDEMRENFRKAQPDVPVDVIDEAISNTELLASRVEPFVVSKSSKSPKVTVTIGKDICKRENLDLDIKESMSENEIAEAIVREWCNEGLKRIGKENDEVYLKQMEHEMNVLREKQVFGYFVVIGEFTRWAKRIGIRVGPGRGSAAGSLVLYLCNVTGLDPIAHGLMFERFLNKGRDELPDVDLDFQHDRRKEVKAHIAEVWGADHVADVAAHQTFGMRSAIQSVARVYDVPFEEYTAVTKSLDDTTGDMKLMDMLEISKELSSFVKKYPEVWKHALRLEGQVKALSKHAGGVVVTDKPISEYMPTMRGNDGSTITAWSEQADFPIITKFGFLKIDLLGIDCLTVQAKAAKLMYGDDVNPNDVFDEIPVAYDPDAGEDVVLEKFRKKQTMGVFQFEGRGIAGLLGQIKPTSFRDIVAASALYRPGPLESGTAFDYGKIKNGELEAHYWSEEVRDILEETYGIMVYQEQIIAVCRKLAGYSAEEGDIIRKVLTKLSSAKIKDNKGLQELEKRSEEFIGRCVERGVPKEVAEEVWRQTGKATRYSFNKSHSAGYALLAYQDCALKAGGTLAKGYTGSPIAFYAALMSVETAKVSQAVREARANGIEVLPPDVNKSGQGFSIDGDAIRFGLEAVAYVGDSAIQEIIEKRKDGPFESYDDFCNRVVARKCNKRVKDALVACGAFDTIGERADWTEDEKSQGELEFLKMRLSGGSIMKYRDLISERIWTLDEVDEAPNGTDVVVGGEVVRAVHRLTKRGQPMCFFDVAFGNDTYSCVVFMPGAEIYKNILNEGEVVFAKGEKDDQGGIVVRDMATAHQVSESLARNAQVTA